jgi:hypothetical protein
MAEQRRERSSIKFPYGDLDDAVQIANKIHTNYGRSCTLDQLAAAMRQTLSGAFRNKVATAAVFGVIETGRREVTLTELGAALVDPQTETAARATAFLNVPLYERVFETFRGRRLPGDAGLQAEMVKLGVSPKQAPKARQALNRSAEQAGFFSQGRDRLVEPPAARVAEVAVRDLTASEEGHARESEYVEVGVPGAVQHPLIVGLWKLLPDPDQGTFTAEQQENWLAAAKVNLKAIYGSPGGRSSAAPGVTDTPS